MSMERDGICFSPIGVIRSPFKNREETPIQVSMVKDVAGKVEVFADYQQGLQDIEGFSHIILLYYFHLSTSHPLLVIPFLDHEERGVFATRSPIRPNNLGLSVVQLTARENSTLHIKGIDVVDGTPLLDIKPYVPFFDEREDIRIGWLTERLRKEEEQSN